MLQKERTSSTEMPEAPWDTTHVDFYGQLPSDDLLSTVTLACRKSNCALNQSIICPTYKLFDRIFAVHAIPRVITTDNGPPFNGQEYQRYGNANGIKLKFSTPLWPQEDAEQNDLCNR